MEEEPLVESDAPDVSEVCVINQYVICGRCKILIPDTDNLDIHVCEAAGSKGDEEIVVESSVQGYQCAYCYKTFAQSSNLRRHERIHTGQRPFVCEICNRSFAQCSNLKAHIRLHTGERPFVCTQCNRSFTQSSNLYKHMRSHNNDTDVQSRRRFVCFVCNRGFADNSVLKMHLRTHSGERPFECDLCGRSFAQESNLRRHVRIHTGDRPFVCGICDRPFSQSNNLKAHMSLHRRGRVEGSRVAGGEPLMVVVWPCEVCGAEFAVPSELEQHRRSHDSPRIVVVTPSGLRLAAEPVTVTDSDNTVASDDNVVYISSVSG